MLGCDQKVTLIACVCISYKDGEVTWSAGDVSSWRKSFGDVLHAEGCGKDPQGQPDYQITLGALKRPAVTRIHFRLMEGKWRKLLLEQRSRLEH